MITDITGKFIFENALSNNNEVNVSAYSKGIYVLKFYNKNAIVANRKIVIQ